MVIKHRPVVLCILDGWGAGDLRSPHNAIVQANTPVWDRFLVEYPYAHLGTSGMDVGLPDGQMGNSEVGHMNIGGGRVVMQDLPRIDTSIQDGSLAANAQLLVFIQALKDSGGVCHLMGLLSSGGVHAHQDHMLALVKVLVGAGISVKVHAFIDGRDTPPQSGLEFVQAFEAQLQALNLADAVQVVTVGGRFYAMDRDQRWERVEQAYDAVVCGAGNRADSAVQAIEQSYANEVVDEFVVPTVVGDYAGCQDGDGLLMANFRSDRAREILTALVDPDFDGFVRKRVPRFAALCGMVEYSSMLSEWLPALFPSIDLEKTLGEVVSIKGKKQLRIAETEKYAHVTFFFNGGREDTFEGEERILVPSPKVATYDEAPAMSAVEVTDRLVEAIESDQYDLIVVNYANTDMVGHTGVLEAAVQAVEVVDGCLGRLEAAIKKVDGAMFVTADHGNAEQMLDDATGQPHTAHTTNPVPFLMVGDVVGELKDGRLCDIAPTLLKVMGLGVPHEMTGRSLLRAEESYA